MSLERRARQAALLERLGEAVRDHLGGLGQIPLEMAGEARAIVEHAEQDRRHPLAAACENLARAVVAVPVPQAVDVLGLVAADLALDEARLGALGPFRLARGEAPALVEAVGAHEAEQRGIGRRGPQIGLRLGQGDEVVVVELDAPALVGGVLGEDGAPDRLADGVLLAGVGAQLAAKNGHRIGTLAQGAVVPALDGREAEAHGLAGGRMPPRSGRQPFDRRLQLALAGRRGQQLADDGEAQMRPPLVNPPSARLLGHAGAPLVKAPERWHRVRTAATSMLCGSAAVVIMIGRKPLTDHLAVPRFRARLR